MTGDQFGRPIHGQREISGYSYPEAGNEWKATVRPMIRVEQFSTECCKTKTKVIIQTQTAQ